MQGPKWPFYSGMGLAVRDKQVFRGLTGSQRTPRVWGVTISAFILLILPFSLYFPLLYLQFFFSVFLAEYLWGFTNNTTPHPRLHPSVSIIK